MNIESFMEIIFVCEFQNNCVKVDTWSCPYFGVIVDISGGYKRPYLYLMINDVLFCSLTFIWKIRRI